MPFGPRAVTASKAVGGLVALMAVFHGTGASSPSDDAALERQRASLTRQIESLEQEVQALDARASGVLGEIERLGRQIALDEARLRHTGLEIESVERSISLRADRIERIEERAARRRGYLAFRLREVYKSGPALEWRRVLAAPGAGELAAASRLVGHLSRRDLEAIEGLETAAMRAAREKTALEQERSALERLRVEAERRRARSTDSRDAHSRALRALERDRRLRAQAIDELSRAAGALQRLVDGVRDESLAREAQVAIGPFKGLLHAPADGRVNVAFGDTVHPRFKTTVPHPGWDIRAPAGSPIRAVFGGTVVFADWLRGYGLTVIVDHGSDTLSIYAHASAVLVEAGDRVLRDQTLGAVGETGSLQGPYLYFEIRREGRPVDPAAWIRR